MEKDEYENEIFHLFYFRFSSSSSFKTKSIESFLRMHFHMAFEKKFLAQCFKFYKTLKFNFWNTDGYTNKHSVNLNKG